jgi:hypothetical protein
MKRMQKPLMFEDTEPGTTATAYQPDVYIRPGANTSVWAWLALLGIPALILFLVYSKAAEKPSAVPIAPPTVEMQQPAHP